MNEMNEKKKNKSIYFIGIFIALLVAVALFLVLNNSTTETKLKIKVLESGNENSGCKTIYADYDEKGEFEYSFDDEASWQKSNYSIVCNNASYSIKVRDEKQKVVAETRYSVENLDEEAPKVEIDFDQEVEYTNLESLKNGVTATHNNKDVTDSIEVEIVEEKEDYVLVKYTVEGKNDKTTTVMKKVEKKKNNSISYDRKSYTCTEGTKIDAIITATSDDLSATIKSYTSTNPEIATVTKHPTMAVKCVNCEAVQITCIKSGKTTLTAESTTGAKTTATVNISAKDKGTISYDKTSYSCNAGEKINAVITAMSDDDSARVKSYSSSNTAIAKVIDHPNQDVKCINCQAVQIICVADGTAILNAESTTGAKSTASVTVTEKNKGTISYDKPSYSCKEGEKIDAIITATSNDLKAGVKSYKSMNTSIATVAKHPTMAVKCINCEAVQITCLKEGKVSLTAESTKGATTSVPLTVVAKDKGTIAYAQPSYTCKVGETISTTITAKYDGNDSEDFIVPTVKTYTSANTAIAKVQKHSTLAVNCINCVAVEIKCLSPGTTTLNATSSLGASTSVKVVVEQPKNTIEFDKTSYSCTEGQKIDAIITATSDDLSARVKSYKSSNTSVATIVKHPTMAVKCINCQAVQISCLKTGKVTLSAESTTGATTSVPLTVSEDKGTISYEQTSYSCKAGEKISTIITATSNDASARVKSYTSTNTSIAKVEKHPTMVVKCINCVAVEISCLKEGKVSLTAESTKGATTSVPVNVVAKDKGTISYEQTSYSCKAGEKIDTIITATNSDDSARVKSYTTTNAAIAKVEKHPTMAVKCINCQAVQITCVKEGKVSLTAESTTGATTSVPVNVVASTNKGTISYEKSSYSCKAGEKIDAIITATNSDDSARVKSYSSSNTAIAKVEKHPTMAVKCINCQAVQITCLKTGNVTLSAESTTGATTSVPLTVTSSSKGTIAYDKTSYNCTGGAQITAIITATSDDLGVGVKSYKSSNTAIAKIEKHPTMAVKCTNCQAVLITCYKEGKVTLSAESTTGATTSVPLTVSGAKGDISYDQKTYTCQVGEKITAEITAKYVNPENVSGEEYKLPSVKSYSSSNTAIAKVVKHPTIALKCMNCVAVEISCLKVGTTTINATSTLGATTTATVKVESSKALINDTPGYIIGEKATFITSFIKDVLNK